MKKLLIILLTVALLLSLVGCQKAKPKQQDPSFATSPTTSKIHKENGVKLSTEPSDGNDETHEHMTALKPQTVANPVTGYCGNTQTTLYVGDKEYSFMYGYSVTLTDILINLDYDPIRVCRCAPEYTVDTEFGTGYGINLSQGYARCEKGQADLTQEQIDTIAQIIEWAETTNCKYPIDN